jgi:succinate-acetate transporter protein
MQFARCLVLDLVFVSLTVLFFAVSVGYVAACERLMK